MKYLPNVKIEQALEDKGVQIVPLSCLPSTAVHLLLSSVHSLFVKYRKLHELLQAFVLFYYFCFT